MADKILTKHDRRITYDTLIQQVFLAQRIIPHDSNDVYEIGFPKPVVKDVKSGRGTGADSSRLCLAEDIDRLIGDLKSIRFRLRSKRVTPICVL